MVIVQNREAAIRYPVDGKALETTLGRWSRKRHADLNVEPLIPLSPELENLGRAWTSSGFMAGGNDGKLNWFDGPPVVAKVVALVPHNDSKIQTALNKIFNFDRHVGALGIIPGSISKMIAKAVNPSNSKAGRLVEKAHVAKLSQVIFFSSFGVWMARKRREAAWKSRDKVNSKSRDLGRHGRVEQKADVEAQPAVRRSARILERKSRAQGLGHADRLLDGKGDRNQPRLRQTAGPHGISLDHPITQLASVSGPPLDQRSAPHSFHSTPRHLGVRGSRQPRECPNPGTGSKQLGWSGDVRFLNLHLVRVVLIIILISMTSLQSSGIS